MENVIMVIITILVSILVWELLKRGNRMTGKKLKKLDTWFGEACDLFDKDDIKVLSYSLEDEGVIMLLNKDIKEHSVVREAIKNRFYIVKLKAGTGNRIVIQIVKKRR